MRIINFRGTFLLVLEALCNLQLTPHKIGVLTNLFDQLPPKPSSQDALNQSRVIPKPNEHFQRSFILFLGAYIQVVCEIDSEEKIFVAVKLEFEHGFVRLIYYFCQSKDEKVFFVESVIFMLVHVHLYLFVR